jgi:hypothetical protein
MSAKSILFEKAPDLDHHVTALVAEHHRHLEGARLAAVYRTGPWTVRGRPMKGKAVVVPPVWQLLTGLDLMLVINKKAFNRVSEQERLALLDDLLSRFADSDSAHYKSCEPDIQEFSSVVNRRGVCFSALDELDMIQRDKLAKVEIINEDDAAASGDEEEAEEIGLTFDDDEIEPGIWVEDDYDEKAEKADEKILQCFEF